MNKFHLATVRGIISDLSDNDGSVLMKLEDGTGFISSESDDTEGFQLETATANVTTGKQLNSTRRRNTNRQ